MAKKKSRQGKSPHMTAAPPARAAAPAAQEKMVAAAAAPEGAPASVAGKAAVGKAGKAAASAASTPGMVRVSTLYLAVAVALVAGLYLGTLLPALMGQPPQAAAVRAAAPASGAPASGGAPAQGAAQEEQPEDRLAGHILELEDAVRKKPDDVAAWVQLGNLYFDTGKAMSAINAYERALLLRPDDANVLTDLGIMYREAGKHEMAVESFRKASQVDPRHQNALFNRGVVLFFDLGRKDDARKVWQQLLTLNPGAMTPDGKPVKDMLRNLK